MKKVVFVGTFTAGGLTVAVENGRIRIVKEGNTRKFVDDVQQLTFSGEYASRSRQPVLYVTERCVFSLEDGKMKLREIAPGPVQETIRVTPRDFAA